MQSLTINVKDNVLDKVLYLLRNLSDVEIVNDNIKRRKHTDGRWVYWREEELDNFGKIAIGLSKHEYDNEDYSQW